jgi:glycolate oxidase iron-sulfur subunit
VSAPSELHDGTSLVDYAKSLDCIHCGLCLHTCPTYRLTGVESSSPRGRIHLMRAVGEGRLEPDADYAEELDFCLLCRHCESVCPAGVRFGEMMEVARNGAKGTAARGLPGRLARHVGLRWVLPRRPLLMLASAALRLAQLLRLDRLVALVGGRRASVLSELPRVPPLAQRLPLPRAIHAQGAERGRALLLEGCVQAELFGRVNRDTVASLTALGIACRVPALTCCGSLHAHNGDRVGARRQARRTIAAFERAGPDDAETPVVVNSAGCGAHLKELFQVFEEDDPWRVRAQALSRRVVDYTEFVAPLLDAEGSPRGTYAAPEPAAVASPVAWDDPCHLCHAQGVRAQPRAILERLEGIETVPLEGSESCCGSAGIYSLVRPEDARAVFESKLAALRASGARTLVTANPGCQLWWEAGLRRAGDDVAVVHLAELVARLPVRRVPIEAAVSAASAVGSPAEVG